MKMRNQIFLVFDSLRWDVFLKARLPFLKGLGQWKKAYTPGDYTLPAHMSFFVGKLPQTFDETQYYDTVATRYRRGRPLKRHDQLWRLNNPEVPRPARINLTGPNIIKGFRELGYVTLGSGGVGWFNPALPAGRYLTEPFDEFAYFSEPGAPARKSAEKQIGWAIEKITGINKPFFLFINFGETHHPFTFNGCPWSDEENPYGNSAVCKKRQRMCIEYLDHKTETLLGRLKDYDLVICSDHGEAMGEQGLWGHGFHHKVIVQVPLLIVVGDEENTA